MEIRVEKILKLTSDWEYDDQSKSFYSSITCFKNIKKIKNIYKFTIDEVQIYASINTVAEVYVAMRSINSNVLDELCDYIFSNFNVKYIFLDHLYNIYNSSKYSVIQNGINSDVILNVPKSVEDYFNLLGKKTKKHLKYYITRLKKNFEVKNEILIKDEITFEYIEQMIKFNIERLQKVKKINKTYNKEKALSIYECAKENGVLSIIKLNNQPQAYSLIYDIGKDYYLSDIGSNIEFDNYNVGQVSLFNIIEYSIKNCGNVFHFMFEITDYKKRFGGKMVELYPYIVFEKNSIESIVYKIKYKILLALLRPVKRSDRVKGAINKFRKLLGK